MRFRRVVFPEPFGPITPSVSPSDIETDTLSTAVTAPKRLVTFFSSRIIASPHSSHLAQYQSRPSGCPQCPPNASRDEPNNDNEQHSCDGQMKGVVVSEQLTEGDDEDRSEDRPEHRTYAADNDGIG